ncbi:hypothetical protein [Hominisplanchenecus murintestinalis]
MQMAGMNFQTRSNIKL